MYSILIKNPLLLASFLKNMQNTGEYIFKFIFQDSHKIITARSQIVLWYFLNWQILC